MLDLSLRDNRSVLPHNIELVEVMPPLNDDVVAFALDQHVLLLPGHPGTVEEPVVLRHVQRVRTVQVGTVKGILLGEHGAHGVELVRPSLAVEELEEAGAGAAHARLGVEHVGVELEVLEGLEELDRRDDEGRGTGGGVAPLVVVLEGELGVGVEGELLAVGEIHVEPRLRDEGGVASLVPGYDGLVQLLADAALELGHDLLGGGELGVAEERGGGIEVALGGVLELGDGEPWERVLEVEGRDLGVVQVVPGR
mmetsp:Transcript_25946/g.65406  ORF Transcript_25946/g.65406 Transcript_25946/m.65406 type:complete len:253 (-) Transcript_25946:156-914(-)